MATISPWGMTGTLPKPKPKPIARLPYTPPTALFTSPSAAYGSSTTAAPKPATTKPSTVKVGQAPSVPKSSLVATVPGGQSQKIDEVQTSYDYNADPILQEIGALTKQKRADAQSQALSLRKQLAIDYGDEAYARDVLGDAGTASAAAANPNSVRAQLLKSYNEGTRTLEDQLNKSNLWYSGERIRQNQLASENYQSNLAGATSKEQAALSQITQNLAAALAAADEQDMQAAMDAANRAWQYPYYPDPTQAGDPNEPTSFGGPYTTIEDLPGALTKVPLGAAIDYAFPKAKATPKKKAKPYIPWVTDFGR